MSDNEPQRGKDQTFSARYLALVGGLMALIIAMLAILWMRERGRRVGAELRCQRLQIQYQQLRAALSQLAMGQLSTPSSQPAVTPFQRQDQVPIRVVLDGRPRDAYVLSAEGARRFGFHGGDVILVGEDTSPTTRPTTRRAEQ